MDSLLDRLAQLRTRVDQAARLAGRDPRVIQLVAVSKHKPVEDIREAYAAGLRDFGENYVQELQMKAQALADLPDLRFHMIGHLQRNKARHVVRAASAVHTVDSVELARELGKRAAEHPVPPARRLGADDDPRLLVLVEVNVGGEEQKSGVAPDGLAEVLAAIDAEPALTLRGLMTVPPFTPDARDALPFFEELSRLQTAHGGSERLRDLSMGMSHDLEQAVLAGATMIRVGTALFGARSAPTP